MSLAAALAGNHLVPADIALVSWPPRPLWRVHARRFGPTQFNGTDRGSARFSPLEDAGGIVPTLYAGTTVEVALMEVVLRDVPVHSAGFVMRLDARNDPRRIAQLLPSRELRLADLSTLGLRRLGLQRPDVIDCNDSAYPSTRALAQWIYANCREAQGIAWTSRQDDNGQAIVLFEPRVAPMTFRVIEAGQSFTDGRHHAALMDLVDRLGASLVIEY